MREISIQNIERSLKQSQIFFSNRLSDLNLRLENQFKNKTIILIIDSMVSKNYLSQFKKNIKFKSQHEFFLKVSESKKNLNLVQRIISFLQEKSCGRDCVLVAIGGGILGDVVGFVASIYQRGVPYVQVPTTLVSMVDSSIGGKTGVNYGGIKNQVGTFYQPVFTWIYFPFLKTLPKIEIHNGFFEMLKMLLISSIRYLKIFENKIDFTIFFEQINQTWFFDWIKVSIFLKKEIVSLDFKENGMRAILNFGHTMGHALESASNHRLSHGFAVGYGMLFAAFLSLKLEYLSILEYQKIKNWIPLNKRILKKLKWDAIEGALKKDKKNKRNSVHFILLKSIGKIRLNKKKYTHPILLKTIKKNWDLFLEDSHVG